jgi:hypothetical protein
LRALYVVLRATGSIQDNAVKLAKFELTLTEPWKRIRCFSFGTWSILEYMVLWVSSPTEFAAKRQAVLESLGDWDIHEVTAQPACHDPWRSPLTRWVDEHLGSGEARKLNKTKNVPLTERWKPRRAGSI